MMNKCQCEHCTTYATYREILKDIPDKYHDFFDEIMNRLLDAEIDAVYYKSIVTNQYPFSDEILAKYREIKDENSDK